MSRIYKISFSNIAWPPEYDEEMYAFLAENGFDGIEIAPTRIFPDNPYGRVFEAQSFSENLKKRYGLAVSSIQSIWYGRSESIFGTDADKRSLIEYTKKAVDFAVAADCANLVFGCPKNRNIPAGFCIEKAHDIARVFFNEIGEYACKNNVIIALEPNPQIYGTNFCNRTEEAFAFSKGLIGVQVNIDLGTIIENQENLQVISDNLHAVNHIHISEPHLVKIEKRDLHADLKQLLSNNNYNGYISVEMKNFGGTEIAKQTALYIKEVFN